MLQPIGTALATAGVNVVEGLQGDDELNHWLQQCGIPIPEYSPTLEENFRILASLPNVPFMAAWS